LLFTVNNGDLYHIVSHIHGINTRRNFDLFLPESNLTLHQKGVYYSGVEIFNINIKRSAVNANQFRAVLNTSLHSKSFCTVEEYLNHE
jgi:hypothetical protein